MGFFIKPSAFNKSILVIISSIFLGLAACQPQKLIKSSSRKKPEWVYSMQRNHLIGYGTGNSIDQASRAAIHNIQAQIARAVFSEIEAHTQINIREVQKGKTVELITSFVSETISRTGEGIITSGVSANNAIDYYYEVKRDRQTRRESVFYAVKYPFSRMELQSYVNQWQRRQQNLIRQKHEIAERLGTHQSIEEIFIDISKLMYLMDLLVGEYEINAYYLLSEYYSFLNGLQIRMIEEGKNFVRFALFSQDDEIKFRHRPIITTQGITVTSLVQKNNHWVMKYAEDTHGLGQGNFPGIHIRFIYRNWEWEYLHTIDPMVEFHLMSPIIFHATNFSFWRTEIRSFDCILKTKVSGLGGVIIEQIVLNPIKTSGYHQEPLSAMTFQFNEGIRVNSGNDLNRLSINHSLHRSTFSMDNNEKIILDGTLYYRETLTGERKTFSFRGLELRTDW